MILLPTHGCRFLRNVVKAVILACKDLSDGRTHNEVVERCCLGSIEQSIERSM